MNVSKPISQDQANATDPGFPKTRLLVIDDDQKLCRLIKGYLEPMGYEVATAHTGPEGLEMALMPGFQAVILDVMLPGMDGFDVLKALRSKSDVPVLMLTARGEEPDRIVGLEIGADDYLPKTFSTRELLARIRAVTRRTARPAPKNEDSEFEPEISIFELRMHPTSRSAMLGPQKLQLTPVEYDLLVTLAKAKGRVKTREQLLDDISKRNYDVFDRSIDVHISALRRKLGDDLKTPRYIKTIRAIGYMMADPEREP